MRAAVRPWLAPIALSPRSPLPATDPTSQIRWPRRLQGPEPGPAPPCFQRPRYFAALQRPTPVGRREWRARRTLSPPPDRTVVWKLRPYRLVSCSARHPDRLSRRWPRPRERWPARSRDALERR